VAKTQQAVVVVPVVLQVTKVELPVTVRVAEHARHPVETVSVLPEGILLVERHRPFIDREFLWCLILQECDTLRTHEDSFLLCEEYQAIIARYSLKYGEDSHSVSLLRQKRGGRFREVLAGKGTVEEEGSLPLFSLLGESVKLSTMLVVARHHELKILDRRTKAGVRHGEFLQDGLHLRLQHATRLDDFLGFYFR